MVGLIMRLSQPGLTDFWAEASLGHGHTPISTDKEGTNWSCRPEDNGTLAALTTTT